MGKVCYIQFDSLLCRKFPMKHTADIQMSIFRDFGNCCFLLHFSAAKILFLQWKSNYLYFLICIFEATFLALISYLWLV